MLHGTTVATNAILEGKGATVGLVTTKGFRQVLQIARSYVPGGLAGWIIWPKPEPLAALENTVEVDERIASDGAGDPPARRGRRPRRSSRGCCRGIEALAVSLINSFADPAHERRIARARRRGAARGPGLAVLRRAARAARVRAHADHGRQRLRPAAGRSATSRPSPSSCAEGGVGAELAILRSDGGLQSADAAIDAPVTHAAVRPGRRGHRRGLGRRAVRLPRPASPSTWAARPPTSRWSRTSRPRIGRETKVGDLTVRASSVDVRTVGAGGGSIAHVPAADPGAAGRPAVGRRRPGPGRLRQGRHRADRHRRQRRARLPALRRSRGGEIRLDVEAARTAVAERSPTRWSWPRRRPPRPASSTSSTRTCSAACGWSRCSRASTRATSPSSPSAAPGRCTPTPSAC